MSFAKKRTACDVLAEAKRAYSNPSKLSKDEVDYMSDKLYEMVIEIHSMAEKMEARLQDYHSFVDDLKTSAISLLGS